jgi:hypothetical protein
LQRDWLVAIDVRPWNLLIHETKDIIVDQDLLFEGVMSTLNAMVVIEFDPPNVVSQGTLDSFSSAKV